MTLEAILLLQAFTYCKWSNIYYRRHWSNTSDRQGSRSTTRHTW